MTIIDKFFSLGPKDPKQKVNFEYALMWVLFLTFVGLFIMRVIDFIRYTDYSALMWAIIMLVIVYFNYVGLKGMFQARQLMNNLKVIEEVKIDDSINNMLDEFKDG